MDIKSYLTTQFQGALAQQIEQPEMEISLESPRDPAHGDYATNLAMTLARELKQKPRDIARSLVEHFEDPQQLVSELAIAGPGFINVRLSLNYLHQALREILHQGETYGKTSKKRPERILLEFVSANPTGPMNVVSARQGAIGDALVRIMRWAGDDVASEYYVNDGGVQVENLAHSVDIRYRELLGESVTLPEDAYHGEYVIEIAQDILDEKGSSYFLTNDEERLQFFQQAALAKMVAAQKVDLKEFRVEFDRWFYESEIISKGKIREVIDRLLGMGLIYDYDGCLWFKSTEYGDDEDRVLIKSDGQPTYFLPDIGYHLNKYDRGFDRLIDIWGPDHHGYIPRMTAAIEATGHPRDSFEVLISQQVNLIKDGVTVKMSKRAGVIVTLRELIEDVGVDVARYFLLRRKTSSHLDFDLDLARKQSDENPVYYVQYAHARICSVLRKAEEHGVKLPDADGTGLSPLNASEETNLIKMLTQFPEVISGAAKAREPHRIPIYLETLATSFHQFYHNHRVLSDDDDLTAARLLLCQATRTVLANGLGLLGVSAPDKM